MGYEETPDESKWLYAEKDGVGELLVSKRLDARMVAKLLLRRLICIFKAANMLERD